MAHFLSFRRLFPNIDENLLASIVDPPMVDMATKKRILEMGFGIGEAKDLIESVRARWFGAFTETYSNVAGYVKQLL